MTTQLLLIDALNLIRRIYAVDSNQSHHSEEHMIKASCARVAHACKKLLSQCNATHAIAVFDGDKSWRYHYYAAYKSTRSPMPDTLKNNLARFKHAIEETGIVVFSPENDEADDIIATLAYKAASNNVSSTIVSTDKGFLPFLSAHIAIFDYFKKHYIEHQDIKQRFNVPQHRLIDFWALAGDKTNDIPGVKGIGNKSAEQLINDYESIEAAMMDDALNATLKRKLTADMDKLIISKNLVMLRTDINLGFSLKQLRLN
ncbi:flap endonuclease Xni (plasmid) [Pseudoalteromonas lipolytica]|uniref:Flap endonuclease Xni n=1 Tax=Pseudoalteromonas lipolytica TaxID=570156 RepID=A0AAD0WDZ9_9GAMM|nr:MULTISPECIES: flap endonuclease Xni [Pseudoalteromonas]AXV67014.1 flap endonuclease Xni [Pseudoalteromonas donghaensis]MCC9661976.1 flap endonuclease Xni [Pseudoalteromonas sp. MB41]